MEELIIKDPDELREIVAGFLRRMALKETKPHPRKRVDLTKSGERFIERLKREGKIAPDAKITTMTEEEPLPKERIKGEAVLGNIITAPSVVDIYVNYLKREDHFESVTRRIVELIIDGMELTPDEKEKRKEALGKLFVLLLQGILSLKTELRADLRDGHIALINKAITYARDKEYHRRRCLSQMNILKNLLEGGEFRVFKGVSMTSFFIFKLSLSRF